MCLTCGPKIFNQLPAISASFLHCKIDIFGTTTPSPNLKFVFHVTFVAHYCSLKKACCSLTWPTPYSCESLETAPPAVCRPVSFPHMAASGGPVPLPSRTAGRTSPRGHVTLQCLARLLGASLPYGPPPTRRGVALSESLFSSMRIIRKNLGCNCKSSH